LQAVPLQTRPLAEKGTLTA